MSNEEHKINIREQITDVGCEQTNSAINGLMRTEYAFKKNYYKMLRILSKC